MDNEELYIKRCRELIKDNPILAKNIIMLVHNCHLIKLLKQFKEIVKHNLVNELLNIETPEDIDNLISINTEKGEIIIFGKITSPIINSGNEHDRRRFSWYIQKDELNKIYNFNSDFNLKTNVFYLFHRLFYGEIFSIDCKL